ncbi:MliC family protein [Microbulbifer aggregans]|uniref:MliC family protein n=1 Tax=Microbulbifer aggregans TaxID=1769779 RepID=UPI001CFE8EED|nr:MliC family protein [Microbulbifer aggregans]
MNRQLKILLTGCVFIGAGESAIGSETAPAFDCTRAGSSIEQLICQDDKLAALDRQLADVYRAAQSSPKGQQDKLLKASQVGWIKGRNDCWKSDDKSACVIDSYRRRIAELQARYELVASRGPAIYRCGEGDVLAVFYETEPPAALVRFNGEESLMYLEPSGSGARYQGRNESLWEHQGEAVIVWGYDAPQMRCKLE